MTAAYSVLSNESSRAEYDSQYAFKHGSGPTGAGSGYTVYRGFDGYDRARKAPRTDPTMTAKMTVRACVLPCARTRHVSCVTCGAPGASMCWQPCIVVGGLCRTATRGQPLA